MQKNGFPQKSQKKSSMIFPWLLQAKIQISRQKKYQYLFLQPMYQFVESITDRHSRTLTQEKKFHDFSMTFPGQNPNFQTKKIPIFVFAAHVSICRINYRQTKMLTHTQTHTWFDQGQPTIQLILLITELIQEVKTTLVNLIKMGNRFSHQHLKNDIDFSFPYRLYT